MLWPFRSIHRSIREMDWLAGSRPHLVDVVVTRALVVMPALVLGFAEPALHAWLVVIALHGVLNHVNLSFRWRMHEPLRVTPRFHHWHHAVPPGLAAQFLYPLLRVAQSETPVTVAGASRAPAPGRDTN